MSERTLFPPPVRKAQRKRKLRYNKKAARERQAREAFQTSYSRLLLQAAKPNQKVTE